ncbi:MAG TPA: hypothetical protein PLA20_04650 [Bacilli bacterium]|nr:hypothetical protein [Bacilli bacterium]HON63267.1 hypothetical protein [Bacilli bacterium]HOR96137.1 hypothetical protein [Bacilli bacterium]HPD12595.1 hypothetical protein [Bacilli bacterium]HPK59193.1 hypothetical protein [Bacilli bacterium]
MSYGYYCYYRNRSFWIALVILLLILLIVLIDCDRKPQCDGEEKD